MTSSPLRQRMLNLAVGLGALGLTELARAYYRPFIRARGIFDFHVADTIGNSLGTITTVFVLLAVFGQGEARDRQFLYIGPASVFVYELAHPLLGRPIDPWDLLATVLAGGLAAAMYHVLHGPAERAREASAA